MRKLEDIIPPSRRRENELPSSIAQEDATRSARFPYATVFIALMVIIVSAGALFYFSSAKIEITPTAVSAAVQNSFTASLNSGILPFKVITAQKIATQSVQGNGTKTVKAYASGPITVYNTGAKAQKLIASTRFATSAGLIFRIHTSITVPAGTKASPGSVRATAYADQPGASYNVVPTSFTVPGLAGTPQGTQVYARSTAAMTGGASGTIPVIDAATETAAKAALEAALAPNLASSIEAQVPSGYVLLPGASSISYEELTPAPSSSAGMVDVKVQGTVTAAVFPNTALAGEIAHTASSNYKGDASLTDTSGLHLASATGLPDPSATSFTFTLSGTATLVYTVNTSLIAAAVAGKTRSAAEVALTNYPEVKRAVILLRPFWKQSFPDDPASISVVVGKP